MSIWGDRVRKRRREINISQQALGDLVGFSKQNISKIERGEAVFIKNDKLEAFEFALKCTKDYLFGITDDPIMLENGLKVPISFDPQGELKQKIFNHYQSNPEFVDLVLSCTNKLDNKKLNVLTDIIRDFLKLCE